MVETDLVERVLQRHAALYLVGLDHGFQNVLDREDLAGADISASPVRPANPVRDGKDGAEVVAGMTPFGGEPAVVEVEPSDHGADVEGAADWIELVGGTGDFGAMRDGGARDDGAEELGAVGEFEGFETAAEGVEEDESSGVDL